LAELAGALLGTSELATKSLAKDITPIEAATELGATITGGGVLGAGVPALVAGGSQDDSRHRRSITK
jgi:hypothetical protein